MNPQNELEQKLWELEFGLLAADEATALRARIDAEPEVASAWERVRAQTLVVSEAARISVSTIELGSSQAVSGASSSTMPDDAAARKLPSAKHFVRRSRWANWAISVSVALLLALTGYTLFDARRTEPARDVAWDRESPGAKRRELKITVQAPAAMHPDVSHQLQLETTERERPKSTSLMVQLKDRENNLRFAETVTTDQRGRGSVRLPSPLPHHDVKLEVAEVTQDFDDGLVAQLKTQPESYLTHLGTDRPWYRRGDTVRFRSVTLSRFAWRADRDTNVDFKVTAPAGEEIAAFGASVTTSKGVAAGEIVLTDDLEGGKYTLVASSSEGLFPEARRHFLVHEDTARQWDLDVAWSKGRFLAGEKVGGKVTVQTVDGKPAPDVALSFDVHVDGHAIPLRELKSNSLSKTEREIEFQLPDTVQAGEGILRVKPGEDPPIEEPIPIQVNQAVVDFYPEGGDLVSGIESRVYFACQNPLGQPMAVRGEVIDGKGEAVASLSTVHAGRGLFSMVPAAGEQYSVRISEPPGIMARGNLPPPSERARVVLDCGKGVFDSEEPVTVRLKAQSPLDQLTLAATCRGAMVGFETIANSDFTNGTCELPLEIAPEAGGVLRLTLFQGQEPLAERLVYRQPRRRLSIQFKDESALYTPGQRVRLGFATVDERGESIPAMLGISVVDDAVWKSVTSQAPRLETQFALLGEIDSPEKLEDANLYLQDHPDSKIALDLLLGTQGWRRIRYLETDRLAALVDSFSDSLARDDHRRHDLSDSKESLLNASGGFQAYFVDGEVLETTSKVVQLSDSKPTQRMERQEVEGPHGESAAEGFLAGLPRGRTVWWWVTITLAVAVFSMSVLSWLPNRGSNGRIAVAGMAVAAGVLFLAAIVHLPAPSISPAGSIAQTRTNRTDFAVEPASQPKEYSRASDARSVEKLAESEAMGGEKDSMPEPAALGDGSFWGTPDASERPASERPRGENMERRRQELLRAEKQDADFGMEKESIRDATAGLQSGNVAGGLGATVEKIAPAPSSEQSLPALGAPSVTAGASSRQKVAAPMPQDPQPMPSRSLARPGSTDAPASAPVSEGGLEQTARRSGVTTPPTSDLGLSPTDTGRARSVAPPEGGIRFLRGADKGLPALAKEWYYEREYAYFRNSQSIFGRQVVDSREVLFWNPLLLTDAKGEATIEFDLSEAATTFRVQVDGHENGRLGSATKEIIVKPAP